MSLPLNQVVLGDCGDVMAEWPGNSVDCVVTDPPYRIGFMGKSWDRALPPRRAFRQIFRVLKPGALAFVMSSPRQDVLWRMLSMLEEIGFNLRTSFIVWVYRTGFPKSFDVSKGIDRKLGLEREKGKLRTDGVGKVSGSGIYELNKPESNIQSEYFETIPASDLAKKWEGWKSQTGLKPAAECILMVNKPRSEKTIVENVLKWGTGAINVDNCRIPYQSKEDQDDASTYSGAGGQHGKYSPINPQENPADPKGRFPANLLIQNGALDTGETTKSSGKTRLRENTGFREDNPIYGHGKGTAVLPEYSDEGSPFRFFDLDAWAEHHGFLDVAKPSRTERNFGLSSFPLKKQRKQDGRWGSHEIFETEGSGRKTGTLNRNTHPTCKPVRLMAYLITLGCPPDGVVVDPFLGSGTTCIAAKRLRRKWIGIEINPEYAEIAEARINIKGPLDQFMEAEK